MDWFIGKRTYLLVALGIAGAWIGKAQDFLTTDMATLTTWAAGVFAALRAAVDGLKAQLSALNPPKK